MIKALLLILTLLYTCKISAIKVGYGILKTKKI